MMVYSDIYQNICIQIVPNEKEILVLFFCIIQENIENYSAHLWIFTSCQHIPSKSWSTLIYCDLPWWDGIFSTCILHTISLVLLLFVLIFLGHQKWISTWRGSHSKILIFSFHRIPWFIISNYNLPHTIVRNSHLLIINNDCLKWFQMMVRLVSIAIILHLTAINIPVGN